MRSSLFGILAALSAIAAAYFFWAFQNQAKDAGSMNLILSLLFVLLAIGFGAFFMFKRVNTREEIHITE